MKLGVVITASFCTLKKVLIVLRELKEKGYDIYPVLSNKVVDYDTRFGKAEDFVNEVETITRTNNCKRHSRSRKNWAYVQNGCNACTTCKW